MKKAGVNNMTRHQSQSGAALVISLVLLAVTTLLGVTAMQATSMDEKMVGNVQQMTALREAVRGEMSRYVWELAADKEVGNVDITLAEEANNNEGTPLPLELSGNSDLVKAASLTSYGLDGNAEDDQGRRLYASNSWCNASIGQFSCYAMLLRGEGKISTGTENIQETGFGTVGPGVEGDVNTGQGS
ncbi:MAG: PilX N-terminal domain-containing pilus assembly protein [Pseudomonadota bacterium]